MPVLYVITSDYGLFSGFSVTDGRPTFSTEYGTAFFYYPSETFNVVSKSLDGTGVFCEVTEFKS